MVGLQIIKSSELKRLRDVDELFSKKIEEKNWEIFKLNEEIKKLTPKRADKGKFVKK
jgi:hypothetical protein